MRICVVTPAKIGLTETFIRSHIERLPHDVVYMHGYRLNYTWKEHKLSEWHEEKYGPRSHRWLNLLPRFLEFRMRRRFFPPVTGFEITQDFLRSREIDVVLAEYGTAAAFITPVCVSLGIPLVAHFHGFDASRYKTLEDFARTYRDMFNFASSVISVSHAMSQALLKLGCPPEKIRYNPYGPDPRFFQVTPDYSSRTLIAVGRQTGKKAPYLTLDAFRHALETCPDLRLRMIGDGELFEVSARLVKAWNLDEKVDFVGPVEPAAIRESMGAAFAFVQHSVQVQNGDSEGTPVAILEAGAAGLPVISTRHAGIPEVIVDKETGFVVEPGNSRDMAKRIVQLANNRKLAKKMGKAARLHVREKYSMDRHINELNQILVEASTALVC